MALGKLKCTCRIFSTCTVQYITSCQLLHSTVIFLIMDHHHQPPYAFILHPLQIPSWQYSTVQYNTVASPSPNEAQSAARQQTTNTQKRLYKHACTRVAPLQPNEWPLSRHLLQSTEYVLHSNGAAALLCSAQRCSASQSSCYPHAPSAALGWVSWFPPAQVSMVSYPPTHLLSGKLAGR